MVDEDPERVKRPPPDTTETPAATDAPQEPGRRREHGGQKGPEPTRYGDWEKNGRCTDF